VVFFGLFPDGLRFTGVTGTRYDRADGIVMTGADGIVMTGADALLPGALATAQTGLQTVDS